MRTEAMNYRPATDEEVQTAVANNDKREIFAVRCRENGDLIDREITAREAVETMEAYYNEDKENECYVAYFYEIAVKNNA